MYSVKYINGTQWHIVDDDQQTVFIGTKQQAEDWLDFQENVRRQPATAATLPGRFTRSLRQLFSRFQSGSSSLRGQRADSRLPLSSLERNAQNH